MSRAVCRTCNREPMYYGPQCIECYEREHAAELPSPQPKGPR